MWLIMLNKLNTTHALARKSITAAQSFFLYSEHVKSTHYIFFDCDFMFKVWMMCATNLNLHDDATFSNLESS